MTSDAELLRGIYQITKGELDSLSELSAPSVLPLINSCTLLRIEAVADFWFGQPGGVSGSLSVSAQTLLCGQHGARQPVLFLIYSAPPDISIWVGVKRQGAEAEAEALRGSLRGSFPDIRLSLSAARVDQFPITELRNSLVITGIPTHKLNVQSGLEQDQIEVVCRGLKGKRWLYVVHAEPVLPVEVISQVNEAAARIRDVQTTFLLKNSATDQHNRLAQRYVDLLEAQHRRLEIGLSQGMWATQAVFLTDDSFTSGRARGLLAGAFSGQASVPQALRVLSCAERGKVLPEVEQLTTSELATLVRLPKEDYPGYEILEYARFGVNVPPPDKSDQGSVDVGKIIDRGESSGQAVTIPLSELTKHAFIAGVTGSGKTNTCFSLLSQIWSKGNGVPFLVIEPAKSEYRQLLLSPDFKGLKVFTVGDETVSPIRLNPLAVPDGILVQSHIDYIKALFGASFVLYPPMPYVLEMSLQEIYSDRGWDLATNCNHRAEKPTVRMFPTLSDLAAKIGEMVDRMGYEERTTMDIKAGLLARVSVLCRGSGKGLMLDTRNTLPLDTLFNSPCVLELKQLVSDEEKAFVIGLLLVLLYEFHESRGTPPVGSIRHMTLIEEAHRLLKNTSTEQGNEVHANPRGMAIQVFANILAEIRSYGEGLIIAEQIPTKLSPDVIKNTNLKIIHRLVAEDDRKIVAAAMNMDEAQTKRLGTLQPGEAVVFSEQVSKPVLIRAPLSRLKAEDTTTIDTEIRRAMDVFRAANSSLWMTYSGCARCTPDERRSMACRLGSSVDGSSEIEHSFRRLLNAMRLNKVLVWEAYAEFHSVCQRKSGKSDRAAYCVFVGLVDHEMERRGEAGDWDHAEVDHATKLACEVVGRIHQGFGREDKAVVEKSAARSLMSFKNLMERLHKVTLLPYSGCEVCDQPCFSRFDVRRDFHVGIQQEFQESFLGARGNLGEFAQLCWSLAKISFSPTDVRSLRGGALCVGVQYFNLLRLSRATEVEMSRMLAGELEALS